MNPSTTPPRLGPPDATHPLDGNEAIGSRNSGTLTVEANAGADRSSGAESPMQASVGRRSITPAIEARLFDA
jgi:hypothetical protein